MAVGDGSRFPLDPVPGVRLGSARAGIRKPGRRDLVVIEVSPGSTVAGSFTRNAFCAAPVQIARRHLAAAPVRYLLVNTGNANAGTGEQGMQDAARSCRELAALAGVAPEAVLPFSTGVIGEPLPVDRLVAGLPDALASLAPDGWTDAAEGIMTTDTRPKGASRRLRLGDADVVLSGIVKGAGMIRPDMATMLAFIATDAAIARPLLERLLADAVDASFNCITVDGDTSTNDACMLIATGASMRAPIADAADPRIPAFAAALGELCRELAQGVIRDAEGATKFVSVRVGGGHDAAECRRVGFTVAESPLVKTALFASDPNWGRILAAVGRAGVAELDVTRVSVRLNGVLIASRGGRDPGYTEEAGQRAMAPEEIEIAIDLGRGDAAATVWGTDLSHDYVSINADYRS